MLSYLISIAFSPAYILLLAGAIYPLCAHPFRKLIVLFAPLLALSYIWALPEGIHSSFSPRFNTLGTFELYPLYMHEFTLIFATIFCLAMWVGGIYAVQLKRTTEMTAAFIYAGCAVGITFSGDFITLFFFWEIMAIASTIIIWSAGTDAAYRAGMRYLIYHFFGGVLLLAGITAYISETGNAAIHMLSANMLLFSDYTLLSTYDIGVWLILAGVLVNAGAPPFSSWLSDAYPESSVSGMVFLSAFTTKSAVFTLLTIFAGNEVLIYVGLVMVFWGIIYAILENDMRRILAYSIINQVGFMVTGAGIGTALAVNGAAAHAFCHIIYKALLLMSAGSVLYMTGKRKCTELGGLYQTMKLTMICGTIGALAISAFPFTSGFISKTMISDAAHVPGMEWVWYLLLAASAGVFLHAGIKFPWFVFFHRDAGLRPKEPPIMMRVAMIMLAALCIIPGFFPQLVYVMLPIFHTDFTYDAYAHAHALSQLQLLLFAGLAFFVMLPLLRRTDTISLDTDWFLRVPGYYVAAILDRLLCFVRYIGVKLIRFINHKMVNVITELHGPHGVMSRTWPIGVSAMWVTILLGLYLSVYFLLD